ncbi:ubiquinone/menaquinone biosynthesis methyltransferase [Desulfomarina profundi]|uniref:Ubiquinone/menaquinone biosynthesis methyltransferase n=1 Tax=Desulfomarina profundi TaxID=2772557 RepID=A0A8D5FH94_9BACT|nr:class I SAM-dependent methyltransferase [Desulfomarina profundi]BCL61587.1 ubiquinone/menaquinone biosynthesis methyltransferase [Desulfomarina profundi]
MDYRQAANERKYDFAASSYDFIAFIMSLGQANKIYQKIAEKIDQKTSKNIVELGCGPASVIPAIVNGTDDSTQITGIDFSAKMIEIANRKKQINNWGNVEFECLDMYNFKCPKPVDTVIFCLALTAIPDSTRALEKSLSILSPGGQLIIIDSIPLNTRWWHPFTNIYIYLKSLVVGAKPTRKILPFIHRNMVDVEIEEMAYGVYTVINARKPKSA